MLIVVSTGKIYGDTEGRLFCKSYKTVPNEKFNASSLLPTEYAISTGIIPTVFWSIPQMFYIDTNNDNALVCAYEYEDRFNQIKFIENDTLAVTEQLSDNVIIYALQVSVKELADKVSNYQETLDRVQELENRITALEEVVTELKNRLTP